MYVSVTIALPDWFMLVVCEVIRMVDDLDGAPVGASVGGFVGDKVVGALDGGMDGALVGESVPVPPPESHPAKLLTSNAGRCNDVISRIRSI